MNLLLYLCAQHKCYIWSEIKGLQQELETMCRQSMLPGMKQKLR